MGSLICINLVSGQCTALCLPFWKLQMTCCSQLILRAALNLQDLTAAFDTVDHAVLLGHSEHCVGVKVEALQWFASFLSNMTIMVNTDGICSNGCTPLPVFHKDQNMAPFYSHFMYCLWYSKSIGSPITATLMILKYISLLIQVKTINKLVLTALKTLNFGWVIASSSLMKSRQRLLSLVTLVVCLVHSCHTKSLK